MRPGRTVNSPRAARTVNPRVADGRQVRAAREERHVVSGPRQHGAVIAADGSGSDHRNAHAAPRPLACMGLSSVVRLAGLSPADAGVPDGLPTLQAALALSAHAPPPVPVRGQARGNQQQPRDRLGGALAAAC